jgi:Transcriptional regulator, AbiEi antitoxin/AbiEi antitoxin C-terminal domain
MARGRNTDFRGLARLAAAQHGVASTAQLRRHGLDKSAVSRQVACGRLHLVFRGVYAVGHPGIGERGRMRAATLACGPGTVVSHRSAAKLLGLLDRAPVVVDVIAPGQRGRRVDGVRAHNVRRPTGPETGSVDGVPCTSPGRTLVDLAGVVGLRSLRSAFERAAAKRMLDLDAVEAAAGPGGRRGTRNLRLLAGEWRPAARVAATEHLRSPLEAKVLPLLGRHGLPMPRCNAAVDLVEGRIEVDFLWPRQRFVLEADSRDFHSTEVAFERDRWRDRELMRVGLSSLRVTRSQAEREPEEVADAVRRRLATS